MTAGNSSRKLPAQTVTECMPFVTSSPAALLILPSGLPLTCPPSCT